MQPGTVAKPGIYLQSGNFVVTEGSSIKCLVICTNHNSLGYQWYLNGKAISGANSLTYSWTATGTFGANVLSLVVTDSNAVAYSGSITVTVTK